MERRWRDVRVGDFVKVFCNDIVPADMLLLHTSDPHAVCHMETSNLDGETNLKQRRVVAGLSSPVRGGEECTASFLPHIHLSSFVPFNTQSNCDVFYYSSQAKHDWREQQSKFQSRFMTHSSPISCNNRNVVGNPGSTGLATFTNFAYEP